MSDIDPRSLVHATAAPETARRRLVPRVLAPRPGTEFSALKYRLKKCLEREDTDGALAVAQTMTKSEYRAAIDEIVEDGIRKSAAPSDESRAVPAGPTKVSWASAFRLPRWGGRVAPQPAQQAPAPDPMKPRGIQVAPFTGTGPRFALRRGLVVNFDWNGDRISARILRWGNAGAEVAAGDGGVYQVLWADLRPGVAPEQREEHEVKKSQAAARDRDRVFRDTVEMLSLSPEARAAWWRRRHGDDL